MAGKKSSKALLNKTLMFIVKLLNDNNISNWFISYGTLLGIVRDNSCINGDDDLDIITEKSNYDIIKKLLAENNIEFDYNHGINNSRKILKTKHSENYCSVDFYMASIDAKGNFNDPWNRVIWSECYNEKKELIPYMWNFEKLYLPFNYEKKLLNRYGKNWRIPQNSKGTGSRHL